MKLQHQIHTAVQTNDFEMRLDTWERMLPYYFAFNKTNYARYGCYYVQSLKQIDECYEGLKPLLPVNGLSVQGQKTHPPPSLNRPKRRIDDKQRCQNSKFAYGLTDFVKLGFPKVIVLSLFSYI